MSVAHNLHSHSPSVAGWRGGVASRVSEALDKGMSEGSITGGVVLAAQYGRFVVQACKGVKVSDPVGAAPRPLEFSTVFDLGSLTEAVCTATLMMRLVTAEKVGLLARASRFVSALAVGSRSQLTLAHLLSHAAGYGATITVADEIVRANAGSRPGLLASGGARQFAYKSVHKLAPRYEPGARQLRSDASFMLLGEICEAITGMPLEKAFLRFVVAPLKLRSLNFIDLSTARGKNLSPVTEVFAPTAVCPRRGRLMCGEVWDEHTWAMGGISGHNGLFGSADDLLVWAAEILAALKGRSDIISQKAAREFLAPQLPGFNADWRMGFEGVSSSERTSQLNVAPEAVTISSGTGCSILIEPKRDLIAVILTSGGVANGAMKKVATLRSEIHASLLETE